MSKKKKLKIKYLKRLWIIPLITLFFVVLYLLYLNLFYMHRVLLNVYLDNYSYAGFTNQQVEQDLKDRFSKIESSTLSFSVGGKEVVSSLNELGISFDAGKTAQQLYLYGRNSNFFNDSLVQIKLLLVKKTIKPVYSVDLDQATSKINSLFSAFESNSKDASIAFISNQFIISDSKRGNVVDRSMIAKDIKDNVENLKLETINVNSTEVQPKITEGQLNLALEQVKNAEKKKITFVYAYDKWSLSGANLLDVLNFANIANSDSLHVYFLPYGENFDLTLNSGLNQLKDVNVSFDQGKITDFVDNIASEIDRPTKDATLRFEEGKVTLFSPAVDGQTLDREKLKSDFLDKVISQSNDNNVVINLPVKIVKAKIANSEVNSLGIKELIGSGVSYFTGSIPNRIFNITLGAKLISGTIVKPGDIFSFNSLVGPVSAEQGFKQAYVINKGRTVLDDGGGICQVSTTVFRAALNSGLPIIKRTAHAYRVGYYELNGFKPGMDATIFSPSVDFQFKNDTDNSILVQAVVDPSVSKLQVDIYGTLDGRRTEISDVKVSNIIPAPDPLYQDDPTLPTGIVKQVDFAAAGATSVFSRKVYKSDQLIIDETFKSVFKPWQAVYLVGKG